MLNHVNYPLVSVIIPVFNDSERLKKCLQVLDNQSYPKHRYEVIVVDNGSEESIESVISHYSQTRSTYETRPGSYAARNKGISLAKGEVIAFTDSDCIPDLDWIEKGVTNLLKTKNCGLVGGKIKLFFNDNNKPTAVELYESIYAFQQKFYIEVQNFSVTANLFTFKSVLEKVGYFNSELKSSGDRDWGERVAKSGYKLIYADDTCISHPARSSLKELYQKTIRVVDGVDDRRRIKLDKNKLSWKDKYSLFYKHIIMDFLPLKSILGILADQRLHNFKNKLQVIGVLFFVRYVRNLERFRLNLGQSERQR